jgi:hypothetical protein
MALEEATASRSGEGALIYSASTRRSPERTLAPAGWHVGYRKEARQRFRIFSAPS